MKNNSNANAAGTAATPAIIPTIHLVLQGKGGVGKSVIASWLAEFLIGRGQTVRCFDGDPVNRSFGKFKGLNVEKLDLLNQQGIVTRARYDELIDRFLNEEAIYIVDSGATAFLPFWMFIVESDVISFLRSQGRRVYIHVPVGGGEMLSDTLLGFQTLAETAAEKTLIVWINEHFGPVARDGKTFDQMQVFLENRAKVLTSIGLPQRSPDTFGENIRHMRERKLTFEEAIRAAEFPLLSKQRLEIVRRELFEQLEGAGIE